MLYSHLFGKTQKTVSTKFESVNHELLTKAGFIDQAASGIFNLLPLGARVLSKIESIIREEINMTGAQELLMPSLHPKTNWQQTDRWDNVNVLFKIKSRFGQEYALGPTHEEIVTPLVKKFIKSYRDLPLYLYHITPKFRDEPRPKSGILRGREFGMKDLYSFHTDKKDLDTYYQTVTKAYLQIFHKCGLNDIKITEASGGSFTKKFSHEFNVLTEAGEVNLIYCNACTFTQNIEISKVKAGKSCLQCKTGTLQIGKAIEVGNIFDLGTRFSTAFDLIYSDKHGKKQLVVMGCYGIGTTRLLGALVEVHHDQKGIIWPGNVAPFQYHLIGLDLKNQEAKKHSLEVYRLLTTIYKLDVLFDDREDVSPGEKFATADLIGIPIRLVVSKRTGEEVEVKKRAENKVQLMTVKKIVNKLLIKTK